MSERRVATGKYIRSRHTSTGVMTAALLAVLCGPAVADEVIFRNGDRLTGKILSMDGGKLKIKSAVAGEVTVDMKDVGTLASDAPLELRLTDGTVLQQRVAVGPAAGQVTVPGVGQAAGGGPPPVQVVPLAQVKRINFDQRFTGSVVVGGLVTRGNSDTESLNVAIDLTRRTELDRITAGAGYLFGRQRDTDDGDKNTTTDNWFVRGKYDYFLNEKAYVFGAARLEKDRIADLNLRVAPSAGLGYQWAESPTFNFNTEAGLAYVYEDFDDAGSNEFVAARLAYHVDKSINDDVSVFHNLTFFPSLESLNDYYLTTDAGIRANLTDRMFAEFKLELRYDVSPAPDASRSDLRYILGVGWQF